MIKINDGTQIKRIAGKTGDRSPQSGIKRDRAVYVASGGEASIDLSLLSPSINYMPGNNQLTVKRSSVGDLISGLHFFERTASSIGFSSPLIAGEWVDIIKEIEIVGIQAVTPRPDLYSATAFAGQTLVTADFSWTYNLNPTKTVGGCEVYLHGVLQARGIDYNEVNLNMENTNQINFIDPLVGGENIILKPTYQVIDQSAAANTFYGQQILSFQGALDAASQVLTGVTSSLAFIGTSNFVNAPYSLVQNRALLPDLTNDLKASFGIERISVKGIYPIPNEMGINGEAVFGAQNDDRGLVRLVGSGWRNLTGATQGTGVTTSNVGDYIEITFFGTALNILTDNVSVARNLFVSVDGEPEGSNIYAQNSSALSGRRYAPNVVCPVASGLGLGVHTARIRVGFGTVDFTFYGFEIVNDSSVLSINVNSGSAYISGTRYLAPASQFLPYSGAVTGPKGGRSVIYLNPDSTIAQAFTPVSATTLYSSSADHSSEEVARAYFPREFGSGRTDDFSALATSSGGYASLGTSSAVFTLDDGTTSLLLTSGGFVRGLSASPVTKEGLACRVSSGSQEISLVFIGTGLDVEFLVDSTTRQFDSITVDGVTAVANLVKTASTGSEVRKIASGLPYGTHVVKFSISGSQSSPAIAKFIVYQPKKPLIPATAIELADYNVMADYVSSTGAVSQGVLKKFGTREMTYSGGWNVASNTLFSSGFSTQTTAANSYFEYTFFGTGIEHKTFFPASSAINCTYTIDGNPDLSSYITDVYSPNLGVVTLNAPTGVLSGTSGSGSSYGTTVSIRSLPLGLHKIRVTYNTAVVGYCDSLDIITPIHSYKSSAFSDTKNSADVGSNSLSDSRRTSILKESLVPTKAWAQVIGSTSTSISSLVPVPCRDLSCTVKTSGGPIEIAYSINIQNYLSTCDAYIYVDGILVGKRARSSLTLSITSSTQSGSYFVSGAVNGSLALPTIPVNTNAGSSFVEDTITDTFILQVAPGFHKIDIYWLTSGGTVTAHDRTLSVIEL
jgi:hypothetical protein